MLNDIELSKLFKVNRTTIKEVVSYLLDNQILQRSGWDKLESVKTAIDEHIELLNHILSNNNADLILTMKAHMGSTQKNFLNCTKDLIHPLESIL